MDTATQIQKLWDMKQSGILTADEFLTMKQRVLSAGGPAAAPVAAPAPRLRRSKLSPSNLRSGSCRRSLIMRSTA